MPNSLLRNRVLNPLSDLGSDVDSVFQHLFGGPMTETSVHAFHPRTNVIETETGFDISVELPGVAPEEVNVEVKDGALLITGEKQVAAAQEGQTVLYSQRRTGDFARTFNFPGDVDTDSISAVFKHGVLEVSVLKAKKSLPRKIEVKSAE